jgi:hypothetical protein
MNVLGKVLVILNLVFALATGCFLAVDFALRSNWKEYADGLQQKVDVAHANATSMKKTFEELDRQAKNALRDLEGEKQNRKNDEIIRKVQMDDAVRKAEDESQKSHDAELALQKTSTEAKRLKEENEGLIKLIEEKNKILLVRDRENRELRLESVANRDKAEATIARNQELLDQLTEARRKLGELETGSVAGSFTSADPNRANPPAVPVRGSVEKIDAKDGLVEVSIGSQEGLKKYHTLEVYRLRPQAQYLGRLRIVEVFEHKALGRMVRSPLSAARPLQEGDLVAGTLGQP